jgi:hypothetical protein
MVEAAGIEPVSEEAVMLASTLVVRDQINRPLQYTGRLQRGGY